MFFIIGTKFITFGSEKTPEMIRCSRCGAPAHFKEKNGDEFYHAVFRAADDSRQRQEKIYRMPELQGAVSDGIILWNGETANLLSARGANVSKLT